MGMKKVYKCDICRATVEDMTILYGVNFSTLNNFTLGGFQSTDGTHICFNCAIQLRKHLNSKPITDELAQHEIKEEKVK